MRRRVREEDEIGELNIVPYLDIVTNLVMFLLVSMVGLISLGVLDVGTPKVGEPPPDTQMSEPNEEPPLTLTVAITDRGFYVAGTGGVLEGEEKGKAGVDTARPPTLPMKNGRYDYAGLTQLLVMVKEKFPKEQRVILVAEDDIPYELIIETMDASREKIVKSTEGEVQKHSLFPEVWLSTMQRG